MNNKLLAGIAVLVGILLLIVAAIYFIEPAKSLPGFFLGYNPALATHHTKHAIGAICLALAAFAFAWFQSGKKKQKQESGSKN